jgi:hypothetical protein
MRLSTQEGKRNYMLLTAFKRTSCFIVVALALLCLTPTPATAAQILYGGLGGLNNGASTNDGALVTVSQTTGAVTIVGHPIGTPPDTITRISGLAFDSAGNLFGSTLYPAGGFPPPSGPRSSNLITLNPSNGALITSTAITAGGINLSIADLAIQPGTNTLFGITNPDGAAGPMHAGDLYSINTLTGVGTFIGNTGKFFDTIAFAPNGTLYLAAADLNMGPVNPTLNIINPTNAMVLSSVATTDFFGALGVRSDGTIFGGNGVLHQLFTIDPITGAETLIGDTGTTFIGGLAFSTPETGATLNLMAIGLAGLVGCAHRLRPSKRN